MILDITGRRQALERMRVSEIRYRRLFEAAHDGVLLIDPDTSRIIDANPFMTRLLGYSRDQLIGKELFEIGLLKDEAASRQMFRKLKRSHEVRYEDLPLESQAGRHQEVEVVANLYQEDGQPVIQCNIRDITVRKLAEDMSSRNVKLKLEIVRRQQVEEDLRANRKEQSRLLRQSRLQQKQLRDLSHRILHAQEEERKRISRELHDVIAQTLVGINVHLAVLDQGNAASPETFRQQISNTRLLVEKAVEIVHDFARELRPTMLDDLGLIPALQVYMKQFMADTGIRVSLKAFAKIDQSAIMARTVLYRIAQEALTNVARHAKASHVEVTIESLEDIIRMTIKDNGQGFQVSGNAGSKKKNRLGLISMRERAEMIGGSFQVDSAPGRTHHRAGGDSRDLTLQKKTPAANRRRLDFFRGECWGWSVLETGEAVKRFRNQNLAEAVHDTIGGDDIGAVNPGSFDFDLVGGNINLHFLAIGGFHVALGQIRGENLAGNHMIEQKHAEFLLVLGKHELGECLVG
jgi:PAS domain S-box-containing protein